MARLLSRILLLDPGPANLAEEVAERVLTNPEGREREILRQHFGIDPDTGVKLEKIAAQFAITRRRLRRIESRALIRLYRWEHRRLRLPGMQQRLMKRIAAAHDEILETLCDAPPVRPVLVGWHDQLVDGRRSAGEIADPPDPVTDDGPQSQETILAERLRKALWANARARKPVRGTDEKSATRNDERDKALSTLHGLRLNARSILAIAGALLGPAGRITTESDETIPQLLAPVIDPDAPSPPEIPPDPPSRFHGEPPDIAEMDPALSESITEEAGMPVAELWARAGRVDPALTKALHNQRLLVDSCMPLVAEVAVAQGLRGKDFFDSIEKGRDAVQELADRFCFTAGGDFTAQVENAIRAAREAQEPNNE
jgi:hypothetical protein